MTNLFKKISSSFNLVSFLTSFLTCKGSSDETMEGISSQAPAQPAPPSAFMQPRPPTTATHQHQQQNLIDSYSNLVISSPKTKQTGELQLPSMSLLVEKNSNQKFFVRLIRLIINLRETIEKEHKKKKHQLQQQVTVAVFLFVKF